VRACMRALWALLMLLCYPLLSVYLNGPNMWGVGFWEGRSFAGICEQLTGVDAEHWLQNDYVCYDLIMRRFHSYFIMLFAGVHALLLFYSLARILRSWYAYATECLPWNALRANQLQALPDIHKERFGPFEFRRM
jgi:hypothetical protein